MSLELIGVVIAVVAVGLTLAGLILTGQRTIRAELTAQRNELAAQRREFGERFTSIDGQLTELRERMAHLEGLLDGLREAITIQRGVA